jgi:hypothetical protein
VEHEEIESFEVEAIHRLLNTALRGPGSPPPNPVEFAARARQTPLGAGAERRSLPVRGFLDSLPGMKPSRR